VQRRFHTDELQHFLRLVDAELPQPCTLILVGGAAWSLGYRPTHTTADIELWSSSDDVIWTAAERAGEKIPRPIRVRQALAGEPRYSFEDRVWQVPIQGLRRLTVLVPEAHDQVLLKTASTEALQAIADLHREHPLSLGTLVERYQEMKSQVSGPRARFRESFLAVIAKLFGKAKAVEIGKRLKD
jgi:hypothetical protein